MPGKPCHPCAHPGCPRLTLVCFCEEHAKAEARRYNCYDRDPASKKRYGYQWQKVRARFLSDHPLCVECLVRGRATPASEVHHILPLSRGGTHDEDNLIALCKSCHSRVTASKGGRWGQ